MAATAPATTANTAEQIQKESFSNMHLTVYINNVPDATANTENSSISKRSIPIDRGFLFIG